MNKSEEKMKMNKKQSKSRALHSGSFADVRSVGQWQAEINELLNTYEKPYWSPLSQFARLAEEVGELGKILNHMYGDKPPKPNDNDNLEDELGDILWTVILIANSQNIDLETALKGAYGKLVSRDKDRFKKKL